MIRMASWSLALTPWAILGLGIYWMVEPVPVRVVYVAPQFAIAPVTSRAEASEFAITEAHGGSTVWRYIEYCVDRPFSGTVHRSWVNESMVWHAPDLPTALSRDVGCGSRSIAVQVPTSNPTRTFQFVQKLDIEVNPLRTVEIDYPPIRLTILANK